MKKALNMINGLMIDLRRMEGQQILKFFLLKDVF